MVLLLHIYSSMSKCIGKLRNEYCLLNVACVYALSHKLYIKILECVLVKCLLCYFEGTFPGITTSRLQASIISAGTGMWSISFSWPKILVYWSSFVLGLTYVQSGTW